MRFRTSFLLTALALTSTNAAADETIDWLYEDVLVALTHQCSESYPDLKPVIDDAIHSYVQKNASLLSPGYESRVRKSMPDDGTYTREQCIGMAALPTESMTELFQRAAKEHEDSERERAEYERAHR